MNLFLTFFIHFYVFFFFFSKRLFLLKENNTILHKITTATYTFFHYITFLITNQNKENQAIIQSFLKIRMRYNSVDVYLKSIISLLHFFFYTSLLFCKRQVK